MLCCFIRITLENENVKLEDRAPLCIDMDRRAYREYPDFPVGLSATVPGTRARMTNKQNGHNSKIRIFENDDRKILK